MRTKLLWGTSLPAAVVLICTAALPARAGFVLQQSINLDDHFGPLGNNPITLISDGTYAYIGGYSASADPREIGILKIALSDPNDAVALLGGTQDRGAIPGPMAVWWFATVSCMHCVTGL